MQYHNYNKTFVLPVRRKEEKKTAPSSLWIIHFVCWAYAQLKIIPISPILTMETSKLLVGQFHYTNLVGFSTNRYKVWTISSIQALHLNLNTQNTGIKQILTETFLSVCIMHSYCLFKCSEVQLIQLLFRLQTRPLTMSTYQQFIWYGESFPEMLYY